MHHTPRFREILQRAADVLAPGGEIRLMLYSDRGWTEKTGTPAPPIDADVTTHEMFPTFVAGFDGVGFYADWYNREKLEHRVGDFLTVESCEYIAVSDRYLVAILKPKEA